MNIFAVLFLFGLAALSNATQVTQCEGAAKQIDNLPDRVKIGNCNKPPCRLKKDTSVEVTLKFQADDDIDQLTQTVNANILGIPFPFVGVDGKSACDKLYEEDGVTKNSCQLKKGKNYQYKEKIEVLRIYPLVKTVVHWALTKPNGEDVICFETPARITN